jgi:hypothetical protein
MGGRRDGEARGSDDRAAERPRRGRLGRFLGLAAIVGAGALWRQRQRQRDLDEELWGDPRAPQDED